MITARAPQTPKPVNGLLAAKQAAGGTAKELAKLLGLTPAAICKWDGEVPLKRVLQVEKATRVPRHVLRPDLFEAPAKRRAA